MPRQHIRNQYNWRIRRRLQSFTDGQNQFPHRDHTPVKPHLLRIVHIQLERVQRTGFGSNRLFMIYLIFLIRQGRTTSYTCITLIFHNSYPHLVLFTHSWSARQNYTFVPSCIICYRLKFNGARDLPYFQVVNITTFG